jgi:acyl carrier protein
MMVEPGEVEKTLMSHPAVRQAVVTLSEDSSGNSLLAHIVPERGQDLSFADLRSFLREKLPEHMIPARYVSLDALPMLPTGKVNRPALTGTIFQELERGTGSNQPITSTERKVAGIWSEVLSLDQVDLYDNFFDLGGHSLLATRVVSRIRDQFRVEFPLRKLFETPTVHGVSRAIDEASTPASPEDDRTIKAIPRGRRSIDQLVDELGQLSQSDVRSLLDTENRSE